jgi:hypothetical protein
MTSLACLCSIVATTAMTPASEDLPTFHAFRILMFSCIFTLFFTAFVLVADISHFDLLIPLDVGKMVMKKR